MCVCVLYKCWCIWCSLLGKDIAAVNAGVGRGQHVCSNYVEHCATVCTCGPMAWVVCLMCVCVCLCLCQWLCSFCTLSKPSWNDMLDVLYCTVLSAMLVSVLVWLCVLASEPVQRSLATTTSEPVQRSPPIIAASCWSRPETCQRPACSSTPPGTCTYVLHRDAANTPGGTATGTAAPPASG